MNAKHGGRHPLALAAAFLSLSLFAAPAHADDCGPLKKLFSLDLTSAPSGVASIPVTINGSPRKLEFDTAGGRSVLSEGALDSLGLHAVSGNVKLLDRAGNASQRSVTIDSFVIGGMEAKNIVFQISPDPNFGGNPQLPVDGALANDIMVNYDLDLDYAGGKVSYFSPDHCDGHVVYWTTSPASVVPFRHTLPGVRNPNDAHFYFHVTMDGKDLLAALSTGSPRTQMSALTADADYDVREDSKGTVPMGTMAEHKVFGYTFKTISFGDVTVNNPHIVILPDVMGRNDPNNAGRTDSRIKKMDDIQVPDITIGMDVIRQLHIYAAAKEYKLYITAAGPPAATVAAAIPASTASASASPAAASSDVCLSGWPTSPGSGAGGVVMSIYDQATAMNMLQQTEAQNHSKIDPDYADNLRVQVRLANGKPLVALVPKAMTVHVGDHVTFQGGYRNTNLPCSYVPSLITADLANTP